MTISYPIAGIDVAKHSLDVTTVDKRGTCLSSSLARDEDKLKSLAKRLKTKGIKLVVLEATGGLEVGVMLALEAEGLDVARINPQRVREFAKSLGWLAKTDKIDAKLLAIYGERVRPAPTPLTNATHRRIRDLVTRRGQLVEVRATEKTRTHQTDDALIGSSIEDLIAHLDDQILTIEKEIDQLISKDAELDKKRRVLRSFIGVGPQSAHALIAFLPELGQLGHKKASALVGVAPFADDSAGRSGRRRIGGGRKELRQTLYMAVQTAYRTNPRLSPLYQRLRDRGRPHKSALIACLNKMIKILSAMVRNDELFERQTVQC